MKKHIKEIDADVIGISELDAYHTECKDMFKDENTNIHKLARQDFVNFMSETMNYDYQIVEVDTGLRANAVFWKKDKFELLGFEKLNLYPHSDWWSNLKHKV